MEDDKKWKMTKIEDNQNGKRLKQKTTFINKITYMTYLRFAGFFQNYLKNVGQLYTDQIRKRPKQKTTKMEVDQTGSYRNGSRPKWKLTKMEVDQNKRGKNER